MFCVRMIHPQHGATHVYTDEELKLHEKMGWRREGGTPSIDHIAAHAEANAAFDAQVEAQFAPKKRGRPRKAS